METKIPIPEISLNTQGLFFRKVGYSKHDVPSKEASDKSCDSIPVFLYYDNFYFSHSNQLQSIFVMLGNPKEIHLSMALQSFCCILAAFFSFLILYIFGRTHWTGDQLVARPLPTHRINAHRLPYVERDSKTFRALDRTATIGERN
jgi:hypothetical protein